MSKVKTLKAKKVTKVSKATKAVAKKKTAKKVVAKKVAKKPVAKKTKPVAKKKGRESLQSKLMKAYSIVTQYSENLMQDVYNVVYRKKVLKRFINEALAQNFIEQDVLVKVGTHNAMNSKKSRELVSELKSEGLM